MTTQTPHMVWLSTREAAKAAGRHLNTVKLALTSGELVGEKNTRSGRWRISQAALNAWISSEEWVPVAPARARSHAS